MTQTTRVCMWQSLYYYKFPTKKKKTTKRESENYSKKQFQTLEFEFWQGLVASVLELMGLKEGEVGENDSLADLGLDSLQLVEIRSKVQTAIGRPLPLEQACLDLIRFCSPLLSCSV